MAQPATFDPDKYKETTREQWQAAAEAWHRWGPTLEEWFGEATELMLDLGGVPRRRLSAPPSGRAGFARASV